MPPKRKSTQGDSAKLETPAAKCSRGSTATPSLGETIDSFGRHLLTKTFTFLVGPEKIGFEIHESALSSTSSVLDRMIHGNMREATERVAELPSIEPAIFGKFAQFCYVGEYDVNLEKPEQPNLPAPIRPFNCEVLGLHILRRRGQGAVYNCARHGCDVAVQWSTQPAPYPYCSLDCAQKVASRKFDTECIFCKNSTYLSPESTGDVYESMAHICSYCIQKDLNIDWPPQSITALTSSLHVVNRVTSFYNILRSEPAAREALQTMVKKKYATSAEILTHAKLYVIAEMYNVSRLKCLSLVNLCHDLSQYTLNIKRIPVIIELINYVYENTSSNSNGQERDMLRQVVTAYVAQDAKQFMMFRSARDLLEQGGDLAVDLIRTMAAF